jgi:hypothetical protein
MPTVFFLPGFAGSQLNAPSGLNVWVSYTSLAVSGFSYLPFGLDGKSPALPCGKAMTVGAPLPNYYSAAAQLLNQQLPASHNVVEWAWDWRMDLITAGQALAAAIVDVASAAFPAVIVAHSAGGLVARVAWSVLVAGGKTDLCSRIITMGTPHQGSYAAVQLLSGGNSTLISISALSALVNDFASLQFGIRTECLLNSYLEYLRIICTWPAIYQLLPMLGSPDQASDPNRPALYTASNWPAASGGVQQQWLDYASKTFAALMLSAASMPPSNVLTTLAGTGFATPDILTDPGALGTTVAYGSTGAGDGTVTEEDALIPASWRYSAVVAHQDQPLYWVQQGTIAAEVLAVRPPPTPTPPIRTGTLPGVMTLGPPPVQTLNFPPGPVDP